MRLRVIKLGGSVLNHADGFGRLQGWWASQRVMASVLIVGGGQYADGVRQLEQRGGVTVDAAHWLALRAMSLWAWTFSQYDPRWRHVDDWHQLQSLLNGTSDRVPSIVFDPIRLLRSHAQRPSPESLPMGWHVTSDSIAAWVARQMDAEELVLLKSALPPTPDVQESSCRGFVDAYFPQAAAGIGRIRCVDLIGRADMIWRPCAPSVGPTTTNGPSRAGLPRGAARRVE